MILLCLGGMLLLGSLLLIMDYRDSVTEISEGLKRNSYGKGSRVEELEVAVGDGADREALEVELAEKAYTSEEIQQVFRKCIAHMEKEILGENESPDHVERDLQLITEMEGEPIEISWELDRYDVMNVYGELQEGALVSEGSLVKLKAVLIYTENAKEQALYESSVMVYPRTLGEKDKKTREIKEKVKEKESKTRTKEMMQLPEKVNGTRIRYYRKMDSRGLVLVFMGILIALLLLALEKQNRGKELQEKRQQMLRDYPEIINKLTLYMGAGMTAKRAWQKIVQDYEAQRGAWGERYAYEEMKKTGYEMSSGITEADSYERFGRRCGLQEYTRLGALLSQNLRRGTKGLNQMLKAEAAEAFEERKARARRLGEEAGTKLLGPMFLMLAVVLVIVIVPAFLSIQL